MSAAGGNRRSRRFRLWPSVYVIVAVLAWGSFVLYSLRWLGSDRNELARIARQRFANELEEYWEVARTKGVRTPAVFQLNPFVELRATIVELARVPASGETENFDFSAQVNWENILIYTVGAAILFLVVFAMIARTADQMGPTRFAHLPGETTDQATGQYPFTRDATSLSVLPTSPPSFAMDPYAQDVIFLHLRSDIINARGRADDLDRRSTHLLYSGIGLGVMGILVFMAIIPPLIPSQSALQYVAQAIRPVSILLFLEAVAWFLLRQHRALLEEYKTFFRIYLRRMNLLVSYLLSTDASAAANPVTTLLLNSLLDEKDSDRLAQGETTVALEAFKSLGDPPAVALMERLLALASRKDSP